jgi:hypothetical protein
MMALTHNLSYATTQLQGDARKKARARARVLSKKTKQKTKYKKFNRQQQPHALHTHAQVNKREAQESRR